MNQSKMKYKIYLSTGNKEKLIRYHQWKNKETKLSLTYPTSRPPKVCFSFLEHAIKLHI